MADHAAKKERVALISVGASGALALSKLVVGLLTGSLAILSEAIHSLLDFAATVMTWFAVRIGDKPADETHHYGHGKVESVAALIETGLLFVASIWVFQEAVRRLIAGSHEVEFSYWAVGVIVFSIIVDYWRAKALNETAKETRSQALEADALHFSSDMWSSIIVLVGLGAVMLGFPQADSLAAMAVSIFVALAGWRLGKRTIDVLVDAAPAGAGESVRDIAAGIEGVVLVDTVRVRRAGSAVLADVFVKVPRGMPLDTVARLKTRVAEAITRGMPEVEASVTANPIAIDDETVRERVTVIALNRHLAVHHVTVQNLSGMLSISLDLEVDGRMPLGEAHDIASGLEAAIQAEFGEGIEVETHIEPLEVDDLDGVDAPDAEREAIAAAIVALATPDCGLTDIHEVRVRRVKRGLFVTLHCHAPADRTVEALHHDVDALERRIRTELAGIARVVIHAEPLR
jgi:cation diffusion facilitator family transporter